MINNETIDIPEDEENFSFSKLVSQMYRTIKGFKRERSIKHIPPKPKEDARVGRIHKFKINTERRTPDEDN